MSNTQIFHSAKIALVASMLIITLSIGTFFTLEPRVGQAITDSFLVTQSVTDEISFLTTANDVSMSPALAGVTGGVSTGTTTVVVLTNNVTGYNMTISFSSSTAMNGNTQGGSIANYTPASTNTPDFAFFVAANTAEFAYTVAASTTADLDTTFRNNGSVCNNNSGGDVSFSCWFNPTSTPVAETIVNRSTPTAVSGATTSIAFRLQISSNPSPAIPEDTYTATATLTAVNNI